MITNILATLTIALVTNVYHPPLTSYSGSAIPMPIFGDMQGDNPIPPMPFHYKDTRENPDVRIADVYEVKTLSGDCDGQAWSVELDRRLVSSTTERRRTITTEEWVTEQREFDAVTNMSMLLECTNFIMSSAVSNAIISMVGSNYCTVSSNYPPVCTNCGKTMVYPNDRSER